MKKCGHHATNERKVRIARKVARVFSALVPGKRSRKAFRDYVVRNIFDCNVHSVYGRIYSPYYHPFPFVDGEPEIFNRNGEKMEMFFIRDWTGASDPYSLRNGLPPSRFLWDRYNFGLKTHFYTHRAMMETMGCPDRRYGMLLESASIVPEDYEMFKNNPGLEDEFDAIFTYDANILDTVDNARFFPHYASPWYGIAQGGGALDEKAFEKKSRNVSIVSSDKRMCPHHDYRIDLAFKCRNEGLADTFGTFDGGRMIKIAEALADYRYSIVVENDISPYFFTQKITDCFLAMTIPVYFGATKIGDFFNEDGIIRIKPGDDLRKVLAACTEREYESRLPAVVDNYNRVQQYRNMWDWLYNKYLKGSK